MAEGEDETLLLSSDLRPDDAEDCRCEPEDDSLALDDMAKRPESMPVIQLEGDYNANTILDRNCSISSPIVHLNPRREGRIVLPKRYHNQLKAYKDKQSELIATRRESIEPNPGPAPPCQMDVVSPKSREELKNTCLSEREEMEVTNSDTNTDSAVSVKWSDRLEDLDNAVKWIKQELTQLKQEDRFLMRRLLDLTARIHLIQGRPTHLSLSANLALLGSCGSDLDIATWSSFMSLDDQVLIERSKASDSPLMLKELVAYVQEKGNGLAPPTTGTLGRGLRGYGDGLSDVISRSVSTREATRPPLRIKRKNSLPTENELEEDHFFDDNDSD
ncbi:hypothetical protein LSH36_16g10051 [Paralvinella palmiformis]|uniref:Uncharacterized protein n=1 Tax=Paralvinella palmiformis TaxID=53620 RepID=A0AAD9KCD9_9ANNE|nr:hypothetical protein LSH36_16g10051 [Paralvinella palmiformis]